MANSPSLAQLPASHVLCSAPCLGSGALTEVCFSAFVKTSRSCHPSPGLGSKNEERRTKNEERRDGTFHAHRLMWQVWQGDVLFAILKKIDVLLSDRKAGNPH
ncbi:MAG: hypothetical protein V1897_10470 [Pseudomonadota bacterium]